MQTNKYRGQKNQMQLETLLTTEESICFPSYQSSRDSMTSQHFLRITAQQTKQRDIITEILAPE